MRQTCSARLCGAHRRNLVSKLGPAALGPASALPHRPSTPPSALPSHRHSSCTPGMHQNVSLVRYQGDHRPAHRPRWHCLGLRPRYLVSSPRQGYQSQVRPPSLSLSPPSLRHVYRVHHSERRAHLLQLIPIEYSSHLQPAPAAPTHTEHDNVHNSPIAHPINRSPRAVHVDLVSTIRQASAQLRAHPMLRSTLVFYSTAFIASYASP